MSAGYLAKCAGKVPHPDKKEAMTARRSMVSAGKCRLQDTTVYRCNQCGLFHVGHVGRAHNRGRGGR